MQYFFSVLILLIVGFTSGGALAVIVLPVLSFTRNKHLSALRILKE